MGRFGCMLLPLVKWPIGPYENQENGAGLLALLEVGNLSVIQLYPPETRLISTGSRVDGRRVFETVTMLFSTSLDGFKNALFQSLYTGQLPADQVRRSFEWLLVQALPDGGRLRYNHVGTVTLA